MKKRWTVLVIAVLLAAAAWLYWGNVTLQVTHISVQSAALPENFNGCRIVHLSDLHNARFGQENEDLLDLLQALTPDCIAMTGDMIDRVSPNPQALLSFARQAARIAPCYYVTGNHEAQTDFAPLAAQLREAGITVLQGDSVELSREGQQIQIIGLDDYLCYPGRVGEGQVANMLARMEDMDLSGYDVLLFHRPELVPRLRGKGIELVLSGHAHGGQVRLPFIGGLIAPDQGWFPEYDAGLFHIADMELVVSRGLGNSLVPLRVNNRPEVVVITLQTEGE